MRSIDKVISDMEAGGLCCDPLSTTAVIAYEAGMVVQNSFYSLVRGDDTRQGHIDFLSTEIADLVMQLKVLCRRYGLDWREMEGLGEERVYDTLDKLKKRGVNPMDELWKNIGEFPPFNVGHPSVAKRPAFEQPRHQAGYRSGGD